MTEQDVSPLLAHYRSTVVDVPAPALDEVILRAADRRALCVRTMRRSVVVLALAAVALLTWPFWRAHEVRAPHMSDVSGYGRQEGATRYYLLNLAGSPSTAPGSMEGRR